MTDGTWLHLAEEPHQCVTPQGKITRGSIWLCDCGQYWHYRDGWVVTRWYKISRKKADKLLWKATGKS